MIYKPKQSRIFFSLIVIVFFACIAGLMFTPRSDAVAENAKQPQQSRAESICSCPVPSFVIGRGFPSGSNNVGSTVGDFNNDGKVDVAIINDLGFNSVIAVTLGNGDGTFQAPITTPMEPNGVRLATGDFNQDGRLDLVVALSSAGAVGIMLGNGNGTFGFTDI